MLKSRRSGLLGAGLAVAVVGALGVVSTLNAGAEQISGDQPAAPAPAAAEVAAEAATDPSTPPATLPWGATPVSARRGKAGTTSRQLHDQGLQAAGDNLPHLDVAPKGKVSGTTVLRSEKTDIQPPEPAPASSNGTGGPPTGQPTTPAASPPAASPSATTSPDTGPAGAPTTTDPTTRPVARAAPVNPVAADNTTPAPTGGGTKDVHFLYVSAQQTATADGLYAAMDVKRPVVGGKDYHSLAELAVQSPDKTQVVEVGWTVDRLVNGDSDPHLFVFHWINNKPTCYNACGFVPYKDGIDAGDTLPVDTTKKFGIEHKAGAWWIAYDSTWVGSFPDSVWSSQGAAFANGGFFQSFGEVAASSAVPCTQMGDGQAASDTSAARIGSLTFINGPTVATNMLISTSQYGWVPIGNRGQSFYYGGPAATSTPPPSTPNPSSPAKPPYNPSC